MGRKRAVLLLTTFVVTGGWIAAATAGPVWYDTDGSQTLTQAGWALAGTPADVLTKSKDYSAGVADGGSSRAVPGAWNINDNNTGPIGNAYMRMWKDPGADNQNPGDPPLGTMDWSQGIIAARVKYISGGSTNGTFGYSIANHNQSIVVAVRNGALAVKDAEGNSAAITNPVVTTTGYRAYVLQHHLDAGLNLRFDLWVSNGDEGTTNPADWTQLVDEGSFGGMSALVDETSTARTGLLLGSFGSSGTLWQGNVDYIAWAKDGDLQTPWELYTTPEPCSLVLLVVGAGVLARRRR